MNLQFGLTVFLKNRAETRLKMLSGVSKGVRGVRTHPLQILGAFFLNAKCPFLPFNSF